MPEVSTPESLLTTGLHSTLYSLLLGIACNRIIFSSHTLLNALVLFCFAITSMLCTLLMFFRVRSRPGSLQTACAASFLGFILGFSVSGIVIFSISSPGFQFSVYSVFVSVFHILEFVLTGVFHPETLSSESFLLHHSPQYHMALVASWTEFALELWLFPSVKYIPFVSLFGGTMCFLGQLLRTGAMYQAASNFTHLVSTEKKQKHKLVTHGLYACFRHPSYVGWFWWSIGTQVLLKNPVCIVVYAVAAWRFFAARIPYEEDHLKHFFGIEYTRYQDHVPSGIPFISKGKSKNLT